MTEPVLPSAPSDSVARRVVRSSAIVTVGTACSRVTGLGRVLVLAATLGFTRLTDSYNLANESPNMVYELLIGGVLTAVLVPTFVDIDAREDDRGRDAIIGTALAGLVAVSILAVLAAPALASLSTLRVPDAERALQRDVVEQLMRFLLPQILFYGGFALLAAMLNARRRFAAVAFAPALNNVVVIGVLLFARWRFADDLDLAAAAGNQTLLVVLGAGTTLGIAVMAIALLPAWRRAGVRIRPRFAPRHPAVVRLFRLSGWTVGYVVTNQICLWVILILAARDAGGVSTYLAAFLFFMLPYGVLAVSVITPIVPELATAARGDDPAEVQRTFGLGLRLVVFTMAPSAAVLIALAGPIVTAALDRGAFSTGAADKTAATLLAMAIGLLGFAVYLFTIRLFYARHDTRTPFLINVVQNVLNIGLAVGLGVQFGVVGLGLANAIAYSIGAVVALVIAARTMGGLRAAGLQGVPKILVAAVAAGGVGLVGRFIEPALLGCVVGGIAAGAVFLGVLTALRSDELRIARAMLRRRRAPAADTTPA